MIIDSKESDENIESLKYLTEMTPDNPLYKVLNEIQLNEDYNSNSFNNSLINMIEYITPFEINEDDYDDNEIPTLINMNEHTTPYEINENDYNTIMIMRIRMRTSKI